jgi:hypothetical protein
VKFVCVVGCWRCFWCFRKNLEILKPAHAEFEWDGRETLRIPTPTSFLTLFEHLNLGTGHFQNDCRMTEDYTPAF